MKHLRKYNEDLEDTEEVKKYISECFIEFIDDGAEIIHRVKNSYSDEHYEVYIKVPDCWFDTGNTLEKNKKSAEVLVNFYQDIETALEKVHIRYPELKVDYINQQSGHLRYARVMLVKNNN